MLKHFTEKFLRGRILVKTNPILTGMERIFAKIRFGLAKADGGLVGNCGRFGKWPARSVRIVCILLLLRQILWIDRR